MSKSKFWVNYSLRDDNEVQQYLNGIYDYKDLSTKVFHRKRLNLIYETVKRLLDEKRITNISALDIGCNRGFCSKIISDLGFENVLGIDIEAINIGLAQKDFGFSDGSRSLQYQCIAAEDLAQMDKKFDFILCTEVIEHVNDPEKVIGNIHSLLSENGLALISLPNKMSLNYLTLRLGKTLTGRPFSIDLIQHLQYPFYKSLRIFRQRGFEVVDTTGTNVFLLDHMLKFVYKSAWLMRFDSFMAGLYPFKYFSQFFFIVLKLKNGKD